MALHIFHIRTKDGSPLFLHSLAPDIPTIDRLEEEEIHGYYGDEPRIESFTLLRNELYQIIEKGIVHWVADRKFVPRFLMSSGVFLVVYIIFSWMVRDPLPLVDEFILSLISSIGFYIFKGRREQNSQEVIKRRIVLREKVDKIRFEPDLYIKKVEDLYRMFEDAQDLRIEELQDDLDFLNKWDDDSRARLTRSIENLLVQNLKLNRKKLARFVQSDKNLPGDTKEAALLQTYRLLSRD